MATNDNHRWTVDLLAAHVEALRKATNNEWRKTVSDLIAVLQRGSKGVRDMRGWIVAAAMAGATIWDKLK